MIKLNSAIVPVPTGASDDAFSLIEVDYADAIDIGAR